MPIALVSLMPSEVIGRGTHNIQKAVVVILAVVQIRREINVINCGSMLSTVWPFL